MKKKARFFLISIFIASHSFSQAPNKNWVTVLEKQNVSVYIDTSNVRQVDNLLAVLSITAYKEPQTLSAINGEASFIKSQILFNTVLKKYSVIGTLYYDKNLKIVGENSSAGFSSGGQKFEMPFEGDEVMTAIYNKAYDFFKPDLVSDTTAQIHNDTLLITDSSKEKLTKLSVGPIQKQQKSKLKAVEIKKPQVRNVQRFDSSGETNPKSRIFTDGKKYSFQVSPWRIKSKAQNEIRRLKAKGQNAFMTEGSVHGRIWYRVRIGYFNSLEETEAYMKKMK